MTTIVTRSGKGSPLTHTEVDTNFTNLNTAKLETAAIPLGTAAAPSISFLSDADSGLFSPGANQVAVATNGTSRLSIDASGNVAVDTNTLYVDAVNNRVAIGVTSPAYTLDCRGTIYSSVASGTANYILGDSTNGTQSSIRTSNNNLIFSNDASNERGRFDSSGRLLIGTSTATANGGVLELSGGITFPATAVAASNVNTLDDYEEGTWTPSIGGDATYTSRSGTYTKVGRKVSILGSFVINIKGTGSATILSDLPFAASALTPAYVGIFQNLAINVVFLLGTIPATTARIDFTSLSSAGGTAPNETSVIGNGTRIDFAATYFV